MIEIINIHLYPIKSLSIDRFEIELSIKSFKVNFLTLVDENKLKVPFLFAYSNVLSWFNNIEVLAYFQSQQQESP